MKPDDIFLEMNSIVCQPSTTRPNVVYPGPSSLGWFLSVLSCSMMANSVLPESDLWLRAMTTILSVLGALYSTGRLPMGDSLPKRKPPLQHELGLVVVEAGVLRVEAAVHELLEGLHGLGRVLRVQVHGEGAELGGELHHRLVVEGRGEHRVHLRARELPHVHEDHEAEERHDGVHERRAKPRAGRGGGAARSTSSARGAARPPSAAFTSASAGTRRLLAAASMAIV